MADVTRAVVIGLDAFDADLARSMIDDGRLPTLTRLLASSTAARTITPPGTVVGAIWPSITTGCTPARHGFHCDRQLRPGTYELWNVGPRQITRPRLWNSLAEAGTRCLVVDAPITVAAPFPGGRQLVEYGAHDRFEPLSSAPPAFAEQVVARYGPYPIPHKCEEFAARGDYEGLRAALLGGAATKGRLLADLLALDDWDFCFAVFSESHCGGHHFWACHDATHPAHDPAMRARFGDVLLDVYDAIDAGLDHALASLPQDVTVMVVLSHGIGPHYDGQHLLSEMLRRMDDAQGSRPVVELRERAIRRLTLPARRRRQATPVDSARRFFMVPNNEAYGGIRLNVKGREPRGRIRPGPEFDATMDLLCDELRAVRNADTGEPVFSELIRTREVYEGPLLDTLPDLLAPWSRRAPIRGVRSPTIGEIRGVTRSRRTGDHRPGGLAVVRHPGGAAESLPDAVPVVDLAPTVASWFGVELVDVDGTPRQELAPPVTRAT
ncbi:MAG TPA: alkaline phosphatase family protein [Acidimicrobiia bacterium]|nr:alkaline phosphatase family protein [Acidimicrobiia bacterium]